MNEHGASTDKEGPAVVARRSFLNHVGTGMTVAGAAAAAVAAATLPAAAQSADGGRWQPARHEQDDWFDEIPGLHRMVFDTTTPDGMSSALRFANNVYTANASGYGLEDSEIAVVIIARHNSTPFAYNDGIWAKYGITLSERANFVDPTTKETATANLYSQQVSNLTQRGAHFAVCQMATRGYAGTIASSVGADTESVYNELAANLVTNAHLVPAGIVAVGRAQERGYSFASAV